MINLKDKLQNIYDQLSLLLPKFQDIYVLNFSALPQRINEIIIGENKIATYADGTVDKLTKEELRYITQIHSYMFNHCQNLTDLYFPQTIPPELWDASAIPTTATIHVPVGCGNAYRNATNWSYHASRIIEDPEL